MHCVSDWVFLYVVVFAERRNCSNVCIVRILLVAPASINCIVLSVFWTEIITPKLIDRLHCPRGSERVNHFHFAPKQSGPQTCVSHAQHHRNPNRNMQIALVPSVKLFQNVRRWRRHWCGNVGDGACGGDGLPLYSLSWYATTSN